MTFRIVTPSRRTLTQNKDEFLWPSMLRCPLLREAEGIGCMPFLSKLSFPCTLARE